MEDARIVDLYLARDVQAITCTAEKYGARLRGLAHNILEDAPAAEECENDTYLQAWQSIPPSQPRDHLFAFLARICRHLSLDVCRRRSAQRRSASLTTLTEEMEQCLPAPDDTESRVEARLLAESISRFLQAQPPLKRMVFVRRYWYLDPLAHIARRYGLSEGRVKTLLYRMRLALREYLKKEGFDL